MTQFTKKNKYLFILGVAVVCTVLVIFAVTHNSSTPASVALNSSSTMPSSSTGQSVDSGLTLSPTSLLAKQSPTKAQKAAANAQSGCTMQLAFNVASATPANTGTANYVLNAENLGSAACTSASISLYYGSNESFNVATPKATADGYYWVIGSLAPGTSYNIALTTNVVGPAGAPSTNEACLSASNGADACANVGTAATSPVSVVASSPTVGGGSIINASSGLITTTGGAPAGSAVATVPANTNTYTPAAGQEFGVWEWTDVTQMTPTDMQNIVNEASVNNFNVIYLTVDNYLTIAAMPTGSAKQQALANYNTSLEAFLTLAKAKNIAVDAESGASDWAEPANVTNASQIMAFVDGFNQLESIKFRGVQYDIEPYLLPEYNTDPSDVLTEYVDLIDNLVQQDKTDGMPLTIVVPHFFDSGVKWTPPITVDGVTNYTFEQIVRLLGELPQGGRTIVMAYRNFATGANGSIALSSQEMADSDATNNVKVLVAQETGPVSPSYVTFYGETRSALFSQLALINQAYGSDKAFAGTAVDYLDPFLNLQ